MGFFKDIHLEILEWRARGETIENTYIYFKDYIEMENLVDIFEDNFDSEVAQ
jgi:hypothetical protein